MTHDNDLLDHEFDGIRERDNPPPNWIMYMLYASVVFALGYWVYYQTFDLGRLPTAAYRDEMAAAAEAQLARMSQQELSDESLLLMASVPDRVAEGRKVFDQFCVVCHGAKGEGSVGPNLTDPYWIHGPRPLDLHRTVTHGVLEKGMVAWGDQLGPARVQQVVAFVLTLKGTNVPGKGPEGVPEGEAPQPPAGEGSGGA